MGFVTTASFVIAAVLVAANNGRSHSIGSAVKSKQELERRIVALGTLVAITQDCLNLTIRSGPIEFNSWPNMTRPEKCLMGCLFKKTELISEDNKLIRHNVDAWIGLLSDENDNNNGGKFNPFMFKCTNDEIFNKCADATDEDVCEAASKIIMCSEEACPAN